MMGAQRKAVMIIVHWKQVKRHLKMEDSPFGLEGARFPNEQETAQETRPR
jgi:hypothetical protein